MLPFPVVGVVVIVVVGAASMGPSIQATVTKSVIDPAWEKDDDILKRMKSSVDNLLHVSSSLVKDLSRIQATVKRNTKRVPEMKEYVYNMTVYTGNVDGAGTDGDVMVQLIGELGVSRELYPDNPEDNFERGAAESFRLVLAPLGPLTEIKVNCPVQRSWFLDMIVVRKINFPETYYFHYYNWIDDTVRIPARLE